MIHALLNLRLEELFPHHRPLLVEVVSSILGVLFIAAGFLQLIGPEFVEELFVSWGYPLWFQYVVAVFEIVAGFLLLFEGFALLGALIAGVIMGGAIATHVHAGQDALLIVNAVLLIGLSLVALQGVRLRELGVDQDEEPQTNDHPHPDDAVAV